MKLRPYQEEAVAAILSSLESDPSTLAVLATGLGKTVIFSHVIQRLAGQNRRVLVIAHREELIHQAAAKIKAVTGITPDIEMADARADLSRFWKSSVIVASVQTLNAGTAMKRRERFDPREFALLITDEAHHATADSYRAVYGYFQEGHPGIKHLGLTATPDRADEEALGQIFASVAFEYGVAEGIGDGYLVPIRQRFVQVEGLDFSGVKTTAGDLNGADLAAVMEYEANLHGVAYPTLEIVGERKTLIFAASVAHAERVTEILNRHRDGCARIVTGGTPKDERRQMLREYNRGEFQFLVNVGVATEGFDEPGIEVVVMARPTKSRALYAQMLGRGTRPLPGVVDGLESAEQRHAAIRESGKPHMLVLDFVGNSGRHKLVHAADILGGKYSETVLDRAESDTLESEEQDVLEGLTRAKQDLEREVREARERERAEAGRRRHVKATAQFQGTEIDPFDVLGIMPNREPAWHKGRMATDKQAEVLGRNGIPNPERLSFTQASQLIEEIIGRSKNKRCTFKQAKLLTKYGYNPDASFDEARALIDRIAANGWKRPGPPAGQWDRMQAIANEPRPGAHGEEVISW